MNEGTGYWTPEKTKRFEIECRIRRIKNDMFTAKCRAAAEDPADLDLIKPERTLFCGDFDENEKKNVPGSQEFQCVMYLIDKIKKEGESKENKREIGGVSSLMEDKLKEIAFDDAEWRKSKYEAEYAELALAKRCWELDSENIDLYIKNRFGNELQKKYKADPEYKRLEKEETRLVEKHKQAFENFLQKNRNLPEVKEWLEFKAALDANGIALDE